ncbi:MAG TPA: hypothetical protein VL614_15290 [Acetobacteraceae bacterium]|nr:hypothetical protein [Acetobacteraceae bacterium]
MKTIDVVMRDGYQTSGGIRSGDRDTTFVKTVLWCDRCCAEMGLAKLDNLSPPKPEDPPKPTIDELLRKIVREELETRS